MADFPFDTWPLLLIIHGAVSITPAVDPPGSQIWISDGFVLLCETGNNKYLHWGAQSLLFISTSSERREGEGK